MVFLLIYKVLVFQPDIDTVIYKNKKEKKNKKSSGNAKKKLSREKKVWISRQLHTNKILF